jgi:hypothetical protein
MRSEVFEWRPAQTGESSESVAVMMDEIWTLVAEAHYDGEGPDYLVLPPAMFEKVARLKERELAHGVPLMILGLSIREG